MGAFSIGNLQNVFCRNPAPQHLSYTGRCQRVPRSWGPLLELWCEPLPRPESLPCPGPLHLPRQLSMREARWLWGQILQGSCYKKRTLGTFLNQKSFPFLVWMMILASCAARIQGFQEKFLLNAAFLNMVLKDENVSRTSWHDIMIQRPKSNACETIISCPEVLLTFLFFRIMFRDAVITSIIIYYW